MASFASPVKSESLLKPVQEIARGVKQVPERFIHKNGYPEAIDDSVPWMDNLVIDFSLLLSPSSSPPTAEAELAKLRSALSSWGCFQVINHGITSSLLDEIRQVTKQFFELPAEEKLKYSREHGGYDGYGNENILYDTQILDWNDRLCLKVHPEHQIKLDFWPDKPQNFRQVLHDYITNVKRIRQLLLKAMGRALDIEETCFLKQLGESEGFMDARFNFYPSCPSPAIVLGVKPHADDSIITILLQDTEVEGLQILKDDQWYRVPIIPGALFVNAGDLTEIISNGIFKSALHRVVTNSERARISLAVFCSSNPDTEIGPLDELVTADRPQRYKKVKNYGKLLFPYYQLGERPINAVRIQ